MGRTNITVITQPDNLTCGPASLKHALEILGTKRSVSYLERLCKTTRNGTSTIQMIRAVRKLGYAVLTIHRANLRHILCALKTNPKKPRAAIVDYLYGADEEVTEIDSGHWATVSSYSSTRKRIILLDSYTGKRKSYSWKLFRSMWRDFDRIRKPISKFSKRYTIARKWQHRLLLIIANDVRDLPKCSIPTARIYA